jgi:hypothetical protein
MEPTLSKTYLDVDTDLGKFRLHNNGLIEVWYDKGWESLKMDGVAKEQLMQHLDITKAVTVGLKKS